MKNKRIIRMDNASYNFLKDTVAKTGKSVEDVCKWMRSLCNTEAVVKNELRRNDMNWKERKERISHRYAKDTITMEEYMKKRNEQIKENREKAKNEK